MPYPENIGSVLLAMTRQQQVPQKITAYVFLLMQVMVKMWGKSPRVVMVTLLWGKPYGLKDQINQR